MGLLVSNQRTKRLEKLETLIWRADLDSPATLDDEDREAIHIVIRIALESDAVFRRALRRSGPLIPTKETDYVCDSIRSGMDFSAIVIQTAAVIRGVVKPQPRQVWPLRRMLLDHGKYLERLGLKNLGLSQRISLVLALIQIETIFLGHFWLFGRPPAEAPEHH